jgi:hypothetical protein
VRPTLDDSALLDDQNLIGAADRGQAVGDHECVRPRIRYERPRQTL